MIPFFKWMKHQSRQENLIYLVMWGMLFAAPIISLYVRSINEGTDAFSWGDVFTVWRQFVIFLAIFLIHNFLLAPLLVYEGRKTLYGGIFVVLLTAFTIYQCTNRPDHHRGPNPMMMQDHQPQQGPHAQPVFNERNRPPLPPPIVGEHDVVAVVVLILMLGMNLGVKLFFKTRGDQKRLKELENQNLEQQLEYLKYQINPHFFMNTLNNIHALVDIDPTKAQETILELSKMMRFVLYEGDKKGVPLTREFEFVRTYINLMRLRYTDKVTISIELPDETPDKTIPPLMLISFIENAFKHGISYQKESFIDIKVAMEGQGGQRLHFECRNSKADKPNQEKGGVGLANVKQRLHLLYDDNFTLNIQDEDDIYTVDLTIPL